ncbi:MAG: hypothetical protein LBK60_01290 [Verrucomicrobiales bacterium]|jgi:hypothetical protein|nr:hypothetical protein [Verrucomicrobiales bacterium]
MLRRNESFSELIVILALIPVMLFIFFTSYDWISKSKFAQVAANITWFLFGLFLLLLGLNSTLNPRDYETSREGIVTREQDILIGIMFCLGGGYVFYWLLKKLFIKK